MNQKARDAFRGKVVDETHTINTGVDEFPRYVVEYVIDNYCSEETFAQDMERVVRRLKETFVYGAEAEDKYWASIGAIKHQRGPWCPPTTFAKPKPSPPTSSTR